MQKPIVILGATAVGKTTFTIDMAKRIGAEIISVDSMQIYRGMTIGTAKPTLAQQKAIRHHLIDCVNPWEPYSVVDFVNQARSAMKEIQSRGKPVILTGGTGFYFNALFSGLSFAGAPADIPFREGLEQEPTSELYDRLKKVDPVSAERIHPHNRKRILRSLEVYHQTGRPFSSQISVDSHEADYTIMGLTVPRATLYDRINARVETMFQEGLIDEVHDLLAQGLDPDLPALQALGYKETIAYLHQQPEVPSMKALISLIQQRTRQFAKRQMTWFRRFKTVLWIQL